MAALLNEQETDSAAGLFALWGEHPGLAKHFLVAFLSILELGVTCEAPGGLLGLSHPCPVKAILDREPGAGSALEGSDPFENQALLLEAQRIRVFWGAGAYSPGTALANLEKVNVM